MGESLMTIGNEELISSAQDSVSESSREVKMRLDITERLVKEVYELNLLPESLLRKNIFKYYNRYIKPPQGDNNGQESECAKKERIKKENSSIVKGFFKKGYH